MYISVFYVFDCTGYGPESIVDDGSPPPAGTPPPRAGPPPSAGESRAGGRSRKRSRSEADAIASAGATSADTSAGGDASMAPDPLLYLPFVNSKGLTRKEKKTLFFPAIIHAAY